MVSVFFKNTNANERKFYMKLIKFTSILLCLVLLVSVFAGCDTPEESKGDVNSKDTTSQNAENISETVSEEISEEVSKDNLEQLDFVIEDRTKLGEALPDMPEEIYRDNEWVYTLPDIRSGNIFVVYSDGTEQGIKEALAEGKVSITDLDTFDILYFKYPIEE